jgi:hypothetical protein
MFLAITANMIATRCLLHYENNNKMVTIVKVMTMSNNYIKGFVMGFPDSVLLVFFQFYIEHYLRKNKIVVPFFCLQINFYELIVMF